MKQSKLLLVLFFLFLHFTINAQNPFKENTIWKTSERIDKEFEEFTFWQIDSGDIYNQYNYYQIHFQADNKFFAHNIPGCGLDCVVQVYGNCSTTDSTIQFTINKISRFKACTGDEIVEKDIGTYYLIKDKYSLRLVKNFDDEPKENYFEKLNITFPEAIDDEIEKVQEKYVYLYNRIYQIVTNKNYNKYHIVKMEATNWTVDAYRHSNKMGNKEMNSLIAELDIILKELYNQIKTD